MVTGLSPRIQRFAALGILLLLVAIIWSWVIDPVLSSWEETSHGNERAQRLLVAYQQALHDEPKWQALLKETQDNNYTRIYLNGSDANLVSARFQGDIKASIEFVGGVIQSIQLLPIKKDHDLQRVTARATFSLPLEKLPELLQKIEQGVPYVFMNNLAVAAPENPDNKPKPVELSVHADFYSYMPPVLP